MPAEHTTDALLKFSRLISTATSPEATLDSLTRAVVDLGFDGAAVLDLHPGRAGWVALTDGLSELRDLDAELDTLGPELTSGLLAACQGKFQQAHTLPLVSEGDLFGVLVLFLETAGALDEKSLRVAGGLADLAATLLARTYQYEKLSRAHADLQASRDALARTERLRILGQMAAGISHDLKNIFNPLLLQAELVKRAAEPEARQKASDRIKRIVHRGVETVERLRAFSRQSPEGRREPCALNELASEAAELCRPRVECLDRPVQLTVEQGQPPIVLAESSECVTAVVNLVVNAVDAMQAGGTVTIRTGESDGGGWIQVSDTGPGIPPEVQRRLFEPFFTTKGDAGTGLGLSIVYAFVQRHDGRIAVDSVPGNTTFTIWFPGARGASRAEPE